MGHSVSPELMDLLSKIIGGVPGYAQKQFCSPSTVCVTTYIDNFRFGRSQDATEEQYCTTVENFREKHSEKELSTKWGAHFKRAIQADVKQRMGQCPRTGRDSPRSPTSSLSVAAQVVKRHLANCKNATYLFAEKKRVDPRCRDRTANGNMVSWWNF